MEIYYAQASAPMPPSIVSLRCPGCRQQGTFEMLGVQDVLINRNNTTFTCGQRKCPNPECHAHVFIIRDAEQVVASYPPETLDFDATNLPAGVLASLEEAVNCHAARCYIAAGIMVRKTLEELCHDRYVTGSNLKERIKKLGATIVLPKELLDGLDDLRLMGNDAAHFESKVFSQVGEEEVELAIEVTKEILKGVYQLSALVDKLRQRKR